MQLDSTRGDARPSLRPRARICQVAESRPSNYLPFMTKLKLTYFDAPVSRGEECRLDTKRKIILALGLKVTDKHKIFSDDPAPAEREVVVAHARRRSHGAR